MSTLRKNSLIARFRSEQQRWTAVQDRDPTADGVFYYSVRTTGVYCRPSCASRLARRENVAFHATSGEAEQAGFRACKRCHPTETSLTEQHSATVAKACRMIAEAVHAPDLKSLAAAAGCSPFHFQRVFKTITGLSPKAYADAHRTRRVQRELSRSNSITSAIYRAGYQSNSRFYASASAMLGMPPKSFQHGGTDQTIRFAVGECSLGAILVAATERGVCSIQLGDDPNRLVDDFQQRFSTAELVGGDHDFERLVAQVVGFVDSPVVGLALPLDVRGTAFQHRVWQALRAIPCGKTASYTEIADQIGTPKSVRAVAAACAANSLAVAIPCHRVVRTNGALAGYRWGIDRKRELLARERPNE